MLNRSIETVRPLLPLLRQAAFCLLPDGTIESNAAAAMLAPARKESLPLWLGTSAELYAQWDRRSVLELPVCLMGHDVALQVQAYDDGELFLAEDRDLTLSTSGDVLAVTAQVMRGHLSDMLRHTTTLMQTTFDRGDTQLRGNSCGLTKALLSMMRMSSNLADIEMLRQGTYPARLEQVDLSKLLQPLRLETEDIFQAAGRELRWHMSSLPVRIYADSALLQRAVLNLLSNALKFGIKTEPVHLRVDVQRAAVVFRVQNRCTRQDSELLSTAFHRLEARGVVPDLRWGVGLGLPLVQCIAAYHGGAAAMEIGSDAASVSVSFSRRKPEKTCVSCAVPVDYTGGVCRSVLELADCLPDAVFDGQLL